MNILWIWFISPGRKISALIPSSWSQSRVFNRRRRSFASHSTEWILPQLVFPHICTYWRVFRIYPPPLSWILNYLSCISYSSGIGSMNFSYLGPPERFRGVLPSWIRHCIHLYIYGTGIYSFKKKGRPLYALHMYLKGTGHFCWNFVCRWCAWHWSFLDLHFLINKRSITSKAEQIHSDYCYFKSCREQN